MEHTFFSPEWAEAAKDAVNAGPSEEVKAQKRDKFWDWIAEAKLGVTCQLGLAVRGLPGERPDCILLSLEEGNCTEARLVTRSVGEAEARYYLAGDYADWQSIMKGYDMGKAIMYRKLLLEKGSVLDFFKAAYYWTESLACIQRIPTLF